ncbi:MAG TPA: sulfatase-like hydrolase/transferase, partial [Solimonas sp.]|nr:sulfatase-like hydrolase/transferase [Solimonas sp.]
MYEDSHITFCSLIGYPVRASILRQLDLINSFWLILGSEGRALADRDGYMKSKRLALAGLFSLMMVNIVLADGTTGLPNNVPDGKAIEQGTGTESSWPGPPKAPANAPNIVVILLDDVGFAASSTFGGPVQTPVLQALAGEGLRYNNFNVTPLCSPTRAALLSGRNPHRVGFGTVAELARAQPGYNSVWPKSAASVAEILRENGYSTAAFGKWHNTPDWEVNPAGPFDHWPTGLGFEHFYGFMAGEAS